MADALDLTDETQWLRSSPAACPACPDIYLPRTVAALRALTTSNEPKLRRNLRTILRAASIARLPMLPMTAAEERRFLNEAVAALNPRLAAALTAEMKSRPHTDEQESE